LIGKISGIALALVIVVGLAGLAIPLSPVLADDPVGTFPDAKLDAAIREAIGKHTGDIYQSDLEELTSLNASDKSIFYLTGLEYCINLTMLDLSYNEISDISALSSLTNLTTLALDYNGIPNIWPLSSLTNLTTLYLYANSISNISPLSSLTNLTTLDLRCNRISDISPLADNIGLDEGDKVYLESNYLDLAPDSQARNDIQILLDRGVSVSYSPQKQIPLMPLLIGGIIAAVMAGGLAIFFVRRRKAA
jgi:hypothetical protein